MSICKQLVIPIASLVMGFGATLSTSSEANAGVVDLSGTTWERHAYVREGCDFDPLLLYALALKESRIGAGKGMVSLNPYALNNPVYGSEYPQNIDEARRELSRYLAASELTDIGIMQVNWRWNGHLVSDPADLLDVDTNVRTSARILCNAIQRRPGNIEWAIGSYHTPNPEKRDVAEAYGRDVLRIWRRLANQ